MTTTWRSAPPTPKQLALLRKLGHNVLPPTRGGASDIITRLLGGHSSPLTQTKTARRCAECGRGGELVRDNEDGVWKHYQCCDMPEGYDDE